MTELQEQYLTLTKKYLSSQRENCLPAAVSKEQWNRLIRLARQQKTVPWLIKAAVTEPSFIALPREMKTRYIAQAREMVFAQMTKHRLFVTLCNRLNLAGLPYAVLKGIVCDGLYPEKDYRVTGDCDLLILPEDRKKCLALFLAEGLMVLTEKAGEITLLHKNSGLVIEVHTVLFSVAFPNAEKMNSFFDGWENRRIEYTVENEKIYTLSHTEHLTYLMLHAYKHFVTGGFGIRQLCDIALYVSRFGGEADGQRMMGLLKNVRGDCLFLSILKIGKEHLNINAFPEHFSMLLSGESRDTEDLVCDLLDAGVYGGSSQERKHSATVTFGMLQGGKRGMIRGVLFPNSEYMKNEYSFLRKMPFLLPFAWILRLCGYLTEQIRGKNKKGSGTSAKIGNERIALMRKYGLLE